MDYFDIKKMIKDNIVEKKEEMTLLTDEFKQQRIIVDKEGNVYTIKRKWYTMT